MESPSFLISLFSMRFRKVTTNFRPSRVLVKECFVHDLLPQALHILFASSRGPSGSTSNELHTAWARTTPAGSHNTESNLVENSCSVNVKPTRRSASLKYFFVIPTSTSTSIPGGFLYMICVGVSRSRSGFFSLRSVLYNPWVIKTFVAESETLAHFKRDPVNHVDLRVVLIKTVAITQDL